MVHFSPASPVRSWQRQLLPAPDNQGAFWENRRKVIGRDDNGCIYCARVSRRSRSPVKAAACHSDGELDVMRTGRGFCIDPDASFVLLRSTWPPRRPKETHHTPFVSPFINIIMSSGRNCHFQSARWRGSEDEVRIGNISGCVTDVETSAISSSQ